MANVLNIVTWNARGIRNKSLELFQFLKNHNVDVCLVSETWLNSNISIRHRDFFVYRNDREVTRGGGVAIIVKKNIQHNLLPIINTKLIENIGVKIFTNIGSVDIFSCYFPGGSAGVDSNRKQLFASDIRMLSSISERYILGGDFNSRHRNWGCLRANYWGNTLNEKLTSYNINIIYPCEQTYVPASASRQGSTLDFFLTNVPNIISSAVVLNSLSSDHLPVQVNLTSEVTRSNLVWIDYKNANWLSFQRYLIRNTNIPDARDITSNEQIDSAIIQFKNLINEAIDISIPKKSPTFQRKSLPMYLKIYIQQRNVCRRNWQRYRSLTDFYEMKILSRKIGEEMEKLKNKYWSNLLATLDKNAAPFWNLTKLTRKKGNSIPILKHNNSRFTTNVEKCNILAQTFASNHSISHNLGDSETNSQVNEIVQSFRLCTPNISDDVLVTKSQISDVIKKLKARKAPGIDGVNNKCLKYLPKKSLKFLTVIFNSCLKQGYFPLDFKKAKIIPVRKPNKPADSPSSYRPISLLSSIGKIFEKIINEKLLFFIESSGIFPNHQFGFRKEHNTVQSLVRIRNLVTKNFDLQKSTGMVLLDVKAAFDSVWHDGLIYKMIRFNVPCFLIKIIESFLSSRSFKVYIGSLCSENFCIPAGCPQGSCLSPILYNLYTSDLPQLENCTMSVFADDTAVLCSDLLSENIISNLQRDLEKLTNYFNKWKITLNADKTQAIYFTRKRKSCYIPQRNIVFLNTEVLWEQKVKYLGIILDPKMKFKEHVQYIINKVNILTRILYPFINRNSALSIENKRLIFKLIFHAVIFYAAPMWAKSATCHIKKLQIAQNKLLKLIYNLPWFFSTLRLHTISDIDLVVSRLNKLTTNFYSRCSGSEHPYINELTSA